MTRNSKPWRKATAGPFATVAVFIGLGFANSFWLYVAFLVAALFYDRHRRSLMDSAPLESLIEFTGDILVLHTNLEQTEKVDLSGTEWKRQLVERASEVFSGGTAGPPIDLKPLHAKIGQQALAIDFLAGALDKAGLWSAKG